MLGMEGVGVEDNFFELGGDSITNIQIVAAARESGIEITPQQIFDFPKIRDLARVAGRVQEKLAEQGSVEGESPLLPSQLRYFSEHAEIDQGFSQTVLLECEDTLDPDSLKQALAHVLCHHDALRSRFKREESEWKQFLLAPGEVEIAIDYVESATADRDSCQAEIELEAPSLYATLNTSDGRLVAVRYTNATALNTSFLLIAVHHLVMDGVSWWVLLSDLEMAYRQLAEGKPPKLPAKTCSLPHWGKAINAYAESMRERKSHEYWLQNIHERCGLLPAATQTDQIDAGAVDSLVISLSERETAQLIQEVPGAYSVQVPEVLLTAIARCLLPWTGNTQLRIDVEGHGREDPVGGYNLVRTLGWFTSIYPISLDRSSGGEKGADLKQVKDQLRSVPLRGAEYGMLRYLSGDDDIVAQLNRQPRADILFNYMGQWEKNLSRSSRFSFARPIEVFRQEPDPKRHPLEINAMVFDGELQVCWTYSLGLLGQAVIEQLAGRFLEELRELIEYCVTTEDNSFTPSDFPAAGLDQQNLDDLLAEFGE
jgi:non-ribosomal peptide synthase protein (TIGR01720 family)